MSFSNTRIFKPLNMQDTFFSVPESKRDRFTLFIARSEGPQDLYA